MDGEYHRWEMEEGKTNLCGRENNKKKIKIETGVYVQWERERMTKED
jgi:hypothetical protein